MIEKEFRGDPPYPAGYYRFDEGQLNDMMPPQGAISIGDMRYRDYWGRADFNSFRHMSGQPSGAVYASAFKDSMILKCNKIEYYKDHRDNQILTVRNGEIDYSMMQKGGGGVFNMSVAMVNALKARGFNNIQDMGASGTEWGNARTLDSADVKNNDWQWWNIGNRYGITYIRVYK